MVVTEVISFFQELDLLEAHLEESIKWADRIVVIESPKTFTYVDKPLLFEENKERFSRFNVEHVVTPADVFTPIPFNYPKEQHVEWYRARRDNRNLNRAFHWDEVRRGCDYVFLNDTDEFVKGDLWPIMEEGLKTDPVFVSVKTRKFLYYMNVIGSKQSQYRIFRSNLADFTYDKRQPRWGPTEEVGWHFTNCLSPKDLHLKAVGISCHCGYAPGDVPDAEEIGRRVAAKRDMFVNNPLGIKEILSRDDMSWAPTFVADNPELYPWLDEEPWIGPNREGSWRLTT